MHQAQTAPARRRSQLLKWRRSGSLCPSTIGGSASGAGSGAGSIAIIWQGLALQWQALWLWEHRQAWGQNDVSARVFTTRKTANIWHVAGHPFRSSSHANATRASDQGVREASWRNIVGLDRVGKHGAMY